MDTKVREAIETLDAMCLGADGVAAPLRNRVRESLNALRMFCTYQAFDVEATRRENNSLRAMLRDTRNPRRKPE